MLPAYRLLAAALLIAAPMPLLAQEKNPAEQAEMVARAAKDAEALREEQKKRPLQPLRALMPVTQENTWVIDLSNGGQVRILLRPDVAPATVDRIKQLTRENFYSGLAFHRVIDGFMAQGGDPQGDGTGGSPLPDLKAEFNWLPHMRGTVSMARAAGEDSANSQFYIMLMPRMQLDHKYTVFGRVISGMAGVDEIAKGEPPEQPTTIVRAFIEADQTGGTSASAN